MRPPACALLTALFLLPMTNHATAEEPLGKPLVQRVAAVATSPGSVSLRRWFHAGDKDWVTVPANEHDDRRMRVGGYVPHDRIQFRGAALSHPDTVAVFRWYHPKDRDWLTVAANELPAETLRGWGYQRPVFLFYGYSKPLPGTVAVYRWFHAGDRDWISLAQGEIPDATLRQWGYRYKRLQFYALPPASSRRAGY